MMNKKQVRTPIFVTVTLIFALLPTFFQTAITARSEIAILANSSEARGVTRSLARVYADPDDSSRLVSVMSPGKQVNILGFNQSGAWMAIAGEKQSNQAGWVSVADIEYDRMVGAARSLVKVRQAPDSSSEVVYVIPPAAKVQVLGHNADNSWFAVASADVRRGAILWVEAGEIKLPEVVAETGSLTKLYLRPDSSSELTSVMPPAKQVILMGKNSEGNWFALANKSDGQFIGWAQIGDLKTSNDRAALPVLP